MIQKDKLQKDILWYLLGAIFPMLLSFIKTPIFTRYFTPYEYGNLTIVTTTFGYISLFIYSWLSSCIWRYYNHFKNDNKKDIFFSNIFYSYTICNIVTLLVCIIWIFVEKDNYIKLLIFINLMDTLLNQFIGFYMIVIRLEGKSVAYNILNIVISLMGFLILLLLTFLMHFRIEAMILSSMIIDSAIFLYVIKNVVKQKIHLSLKSFSISIVKSFLNYGFVAIVCNVCLLVLTSSDRYIIKILSNIENVGIYNQVYNLGQTSIAAFVGVYFNAVNPILYEHLEKDIDNSNSVIRKYTIIYIIVILPLTVYFSLFSKQISILLLGEKFRVGYRMMPYVMITSFIYGLTLFIEVKLKFMNKLSIVTVGFLLSAVMNIILNFIFIPKFGYQAAAVTTLISYVFLYLYYYCNDSGKFFNSKSNLKQLLVSLIILLLQVCLDILIRNFVNINEFYTILEGIIFLFIYFLFNRKYIRNLNKKQE